MAFFPKLFQSRTKKSETAFFITLCEVSPGIIWAGGYASGIFQITKKNGNIEYLTPAQSFHLNVRADKYIRDIKKGQIRVYMVRRIL